MYAHTPDLIRGGGGAIVTISTFLSGMCSTWLLWFGSLINMIKKNKVRGKMWKKVSPKNLQFSEGISKFTKFLWWGPSIFYSFFPFLFFNIPTNTLPYIFFKKSWRTLVLSSFYRRDTPTYSSPLPLSECILILLIPCKMEAKWECRRSMINKI